MRQKIAVSRITEFERDFSVIRVVDQKVNLTDDDLRLQKAELSSALLFKRTTDIGYDTDGCLDVGHPPKLRGMSDIPNIKRIGYFCKNIF